MSILLSLVFTFSFCIPTIVSATKNILRKGKTSVGKWSTACVFSFAIGYATVAGFNQYSVHSLFEDCFSYYAWLGCIISTVLLVLGLSAILVQNRKELFQKARISQIVFAVLTLGLALACAYVTASAGFSVAVNFTGVVTYEHCSVAGMINLVDYVASEMQAYHFVEPVIAYFVYAMTIIVVFFLGFAVSKSVDNLLGGKSSATGVSVPALIASILCLIFAVVFKMSFETFLSGAVTCAVTMSYYIAMPVLALLALVFAAILGNITRKNNVLIKANR